MEDIHALGLLAKEIQCIQSIPNPPPGYDGIEKFCKITTEVIDHALDVTQKVARYGEAINAKLEEIQSALKQSTKKIEEQIKKAIDSIEEGFHEGRDEAQGPARAHAGTILRRNGIVGTKSKISSKEMEHMLLLQSLEMKKQRLDEFIIKTQQIMEKIKQGVSVTNSDIEQLRGCLGSRMEDKKESYQEEQNRLANERNKREKEESKVKEKEQGKREDDEDRKGKKKKEDNGRVKREEEERKRKEHEEKKRKEEEDRRNKEEEERLKRETEEKQRNEEMKQRNELERKKREEEETKKREAKMKQEEERRRKDPANWAPHTYRRSDGESDSFHRDICCQVFAMPETLQEEDLECLASDEWRDNEGPTLAIGEKVASSYIEVKVKEDEKDLKVPMRICVPHCSVSDSSDEVIVKASIDGGEWTNQHPVTVPARQTSQPDLKYAAIDVANFHTVKLLAVIKTRSQELVVDKNGISQASTLDKNIKLFVPSDTFHKTTKMTLDVNM